VPTPAPAHVRAKYQGSGNEHVDRIEMELKSLKERRRDVEAKCFQAYLDSKEALFKSETADLDLALAHETLVQVQKRVIDAQYEAMKRE